MFCRCVLVTGLVWCSALLMKIEYTFNAAMASGKVRYYAARWYVRSST
jgi:hypothetical protein